MKKTFFIILACLLVAVCAIPVITPVFGTPIMNVRSYFGAFTGPASGIVQDDNVKASLDLAHTDLDAILADTAAQDSAAELQVLIAGGYRCVAVEPASIAAVTNLFAVSGDPIIIRDIIGVVTTDIVATTCKINYNIDPTEPATDTVFGTDADAMEINGDAAGTVYTWDGVIAADLTPTTNGVLLTQGTDVAAGLLCPVGMIELAATATNAGVIKFYMVYSPLSPDSVVTPQ